jgi:hypothetical protein
MRSRETILETKLSSIRKKIFTCDNTAFIMDINLLNGIEACIAVFARDTSIPLVI